MNELFHASNHSIPTTFLDLPIQVRQIQVKDLGEIATVAQPIKKALNNDLNNIDAVLNDTLMQSLAFCSILCNVPHDVLIKAFLESYDDTKALIKLCLTANQAYFISEKPEQDQDEQGGKSLWFDAFQFLISHGHKHDDIMNMSYGAFLAYIKAVQRTYVNGMIADANVYRMAQHGDTKGFSKFMDSLRKIK